MAVKPEEKQQFEVGMHSFRIVGKARLFDGIEAPKANERKTWLGVLSGFGVETSEGNIVSVHLNGGRDIKNNVIYCFGKDKTRMQVPVNDRHNKEILEKVSDFNFKKANLETFNYKDSKKFLDYVDFTNYIRENLQEGAEIVVSGNVEYNVNYKDDGDVVYRKLVVNNIYLNEILSETNEVKLAHEAIIRQEYIFSSDSVPSDIKKQLKENGKVVIPAYVPQYLGKYKNSNGDYVDWKKNVAMAQTIVVKAKELDDIESIVKKVTTLFKPKKDKLATRLLEVNVVEGYEKSSGKKVISKEMQDLIDEGILSEEEIQEAPAIKSTRVNELQFSRLLTVEDEDGMTKLAGGLDTYSENLLYTTRPNIEVDEIDVFDGGSTKKSISLEDLDDDDDDLPF